MTTVASRANPRSSDAVSTRPMTSEDLEEVVRIDEATTGRSRRAYYAKRMAALQEAAPDVALVAQLDGAVAGFCCAHVLDGEFGDEGAVGVLDWLGVDPRTRGDGVGRLLLTRMCEGLRAEGCALLRTQAGWHEHALVRFFAGNGFDLADRIVLERTVDTPADNEEPIHPHEMDLVPDRPRDTVAVRGLTHDDLLPVVRVDRSVTGRDRERYYARLVDEALNRAGVRVSLVAEFDGVLAGVLMARVDYGEYGLPEPSAVLDTIVVDPAHGGQHVAREMLRQLLANLATLQVDILRTEVDWADQALLGFFAHDGFRPAQRLSFARPL